MVPTLLLLALLQSAAADSIDPADLTHDDIERTRDIFIEALYEHQGPQGHWDPDSMPSGESTNQQTGGYTALACLALLSGGESYQDERLRDALAYLQRIEPIGTYAVATRAMVWSSLPEQYKRNLGRDAQWLIDSFNEQAAGWDYKARPSGTITSPSPSVRHFGILALWEAAKRGYSVPPGLLAAIEGATLQSQNRDGSWSYKNESGPSGSMTAAGLVTLAITDELLHAKDAVSLKRTNGPRERSAMGGLAWLESNFDAIQTPGTTSRGSRFPMYWLYAIERVGLAQGLTRLGGSDWFREGAATIRNRFLDENHDGSWTLKSTYRSGGRSSAVRELCFGLLFLSRGNAPVAINKLQVDGWRWNNRPRDVANLCRHMSDEHETRLHWQVVPLDEEHAGFFDAPVLYIASDTALPFIKEHEKEIRRFDGEARAYLQRRSEGILEEGERAPRPPRIEEIDAIRTYLDHGGTLLCVNEGKNASFTRSVQDLGTLLHPGIDWKKTDARHWVFKEPHPVSGRKPAVETLGTGVRERIFLVPRGDPSASLQALDRSSPGVMATLSNIHARASGMLRTPPRLDVSIPESPGTPRQVQARIVKGVHGGDWNAEPRALPLLTLELERRGTTSSVRSRMIRKEHLGAEADLLVISGTSDTSIDADAWDAIIEFVRRDGGVVLFEHAGGGDGGIFASRAEQDAMQHFGQPVRSARSTAVLTGDGLEGGIDCTEVSWQPFSITEIFAEATNSPRLRCMSIDGTPRIFFSREDLSHALLDRPSWGIHGYSTRSAKALLCNLVHYALQVKKAS
ncbi:MAG: hypothetical protein CMJ36_05220 [Phycisphaerae bacterium]|nr:hypothetical protein [Phycisphaerae bacterium]